MPFCCLLRHCGHCSAAAPADLPGGLSPSVPQHVIFEGWDYHHQSGTHFEVSIALGKVMDERGGVMLAWEMNGQELLPDHGYPVRSVARCSQAVVSVKNKALF